VASASSSKGFGWAERLFITNRIERVDKLCPMATNTLMLAYSVILLMSFARIFFNNATWPA